MFPRGKNRIGAAVALVAVLAMVLAAPAGAAGWAGWGEERGWASVLYQHVLTWLGLASSPEPGMVFKCDRGATIDPNGGCAASLPSDAKTDEGPHIDPNG